MMVFTHGNGVFRGMREELQLGGIVDFRFTCVPVVDGGNDSQ